MDASKHANDAIMARKEKKILEQELEPIKKTVKSLDE